jgi:hypothetical protein
MTRHTPTYAEQRTGHTTFARNSDHDADLCDVSPRSGPHRLAPGVTSSARFSRSLDLTQGRPTGFGCPFTLWADFTQGATQCQGQPMTRKDYKAIAEAIHGEVMRQHSDAQRALEAVAYEIAGALVRNNANFDRDKFIVACGVRS